MLGEWNEGGWWLRRLRWSISDPEALLRATLLYLHVSVPLLCVK